MSEPLEPSATYVLGVETSCDETAASVVENGRTVRSSIVSSQIDLHARFGGVVPELASRAHLERIVPVIAAALEDAGFDPTGHAREGDASIGAVAATVGPGLIGSLLVGVSAAKSFAIAIDRPFIGVNHLEGHLYAAFLEDPQIALPAIVLLVSGGHTLLVEMRALGEYAVIGSTVDDAAGEAFDKIARYLGLTYPGGPEIERLAAAGATDAFDFPRSMLGDGFDFSFSGVKSAVVREVAAHPTHRSEDVAASFQAAVVDVLVAKTTAAAELTGAVSICLAGGVAANGALRAAIADVGVRSGRHVYLPSRQMCTDNAAMIAAVGTVRLALDGPTALSVGAEPSLGFSAPRRR